jgi:hypothetical protein
MSNKQNGTRCIARTTEGRPCRAFAGIGKKFCYLHADPDRARELGRIGGRKNRHLLAEALDPLPAANTALAVLNNATQTMNDVRSGKLDPKTALSLVQLLGLQTSGH